MVRWTGLIKKNIKGLKAMQYFEGEFYKLYLEGKGKRISSLLKLQAQSELWITLGRDHTALESDS